MAAFISIRSIWGLLFLEGRSLGKNNANGKTFLEKDRMKSSELENPFSAATVTLGKSFEGQIVEDNMEVGVCNEADFRTFIPTDFQAVKAY